MSFSAIEKTKLCNILEVGHIELCRKIGNKGFVGWTAAIANFDSILRPCKSRVVVKKLVVLLSAGITIEFLEFEKDCRTFIPFKKIALGVGEMGFVFPVVEFGCVCDITVGTRLRTICERVVSLNKCCSVHARTNIQSVIIVEFHQDEGEGIISCLTGRERFALHWRHLLSLSAEEFSFYLWKGRKERS